MIAAFMVGRVLLAAYYLFSASNHFRNLDGMTRIIGSKGFPIPRLFAVGAGGLLLIAGLSFLTGLYPLAGVIAVALFMVPVTITMHNFWAFSDPNVRNSQRVNFTKNMALVACALVFLAIPQPWPLSL
jgi:uncharacterized membrane protein YphA (DoxX/SURF4 family)